MWTPKTSNKSNSNRVDTTGRTSMNPYSTSFGSSSVVSNESGGFDNNIHGSYTPYSPPSFASRSGAQQTQRSAPSVRNTPHALTNEFSQLSLGSSYTHSGVKKTDGPPLIPNKPHVVPNKGHAGHGFVSADGSGLGSAALPIVFNPASGLNLWAPRTVPTPGSSHVEAPAPFSRDLSGYSHIGAPFPYSQNQFQDEVGHFSYMRLLNDPHDDDGANVGTNDLYNHSRYYSSVSDHQGQPGLKRTNNFSFFQHNQYFGIPNEGFSSWSPYEGGLHIGRTVDYSATQLHKEHLVQSQQYSQYQHFQQPQPLPQDHDSSINATGFSFPAPAIQHFQPSHRRLYNPLRGKEVMPTQGSELGPDEYGLLGLLKTLKGVNPEKTSLAMGVDLHSLGLDLNSLEPLHQKFASPWSDEPLKEGPKYDIPECYNSKRPPALKRSLFQKFLPALLFYIFYSMPQDQAQLFAANELHDRGWYYHRELRMWFTRDRNSVPAVKNAAYEVGNYIFFDPNSWQTIRQDHFTLYYDMIEQRPTIPPER